MTNTPDPSDYLVQNHGSIFLVVPQTDAARENLQENAPDEAQFFGGGLVVEHRYILDLVAQLQQEGWAVR
jgi:hypothetical protein